MFREVFPLESRHPDTSRLRPFDIDVPDSVVQGIVQRVADYRWGAMPQLDGWSYGTNLSYMKGSRPRAWCNSARFRRLRLK